MRDMAVGHGIPDGDGGRGRGGQRRLGEGAADAKGRRGGVTVHVVRQRGTQAEEEAPARVSAVGERQSGATAHLYLSSSIWSSKNFERRAKKAEAVRRLSLPAWCCGPMRGTLRSSASSCRPPLSVLHAFIRYSGRGLVMRHPDEGAHTY